VSAENDRDSGSAPEEERAEAAAEPAHPGRAIVTYGRSLISLVIARSLTERGVEVIGCDDVGMTVLSFSKHVDETFLHPSLEDDEESALAVFEEKVRKYAPDDGRPYVLIPGFRDARIFAKHRDRFEPLIRVAAPDAESINAVDPKDQFARFLEEHGLPGPATRILPPGTERRAPEDAVYPLIAKPCDGVGGRGVAKVDDAAELGAYLGEADDGDTILLQELIEGQDYCISFVAVRGETIGVVAYRNLTQFPRDAGAGAVRETVDATPFMEATRKLARVTKWNGVAEIDFRWNGDPDVSPKMIEVNPRYWAGLFHSTASGVDFPWIAYSIAADLPVVHPDEDAVKVGFRSRTPVAWLLSAAEEVAASNVHLQKAAEAWAEARDRVSQGRILGALRKVMQSSAVSVRGAEVMQALRDEMKKHDGLPSELNSDKDPAVALGVLFALSSLMRHGRLPPELIFDPPEKAEAKAAPAREESADDAARIRDVVKRRPVIGITKPANGDWLSYQAMRFAVWLAGGKAVSLTSKAPRDPQSIDGLLFGGGADVYPESYQGETKTGYKYDLARDEMEASWADAALKHDIPIMGVCRGMQMLNVLEGGTLSPDLSAYDKTYPGTFMQRIFYRKPIEITPDSWLAKATGEHRLMVNSVHTQAVKELGDDLTITAREPNGLIQAIEHQQSRFMIGVQFHPEFLIYRRFARRIFEAFVAAARGKALSRVREDAQQAA
jgi:gamma-glutamyl-gamma-aminobutyrate hydrolase PuuD/predicted ATP-grasp superfamily ATP-dependent carboligase